MKAPDWRIELLKLTLFLAIGYAYIIFLVYALHP